MFCQDWKHYPYSPKGSLISFPADEGRHTDEPVEWWYTSGHVRGKTTGKHFSYMLSYFYYKVGSIEGFRILNITDDDKKVFHTETQLLTFDTIALDKLNICAKKFDGKKETWKNKYKDNKIIPFEYKIKAMSSDVLLDLDYHTRKRPLIVGKNGYFNFGNDNYSYYYSQTGISVKGRITYNGVTEDIAGTSWIERQFGNLDPSDGTAYEWFSIQLSNNMDINLWNIFTSDNKIPNDKKFKILAVYVNDHKQFTTSDFKLKRLKYVWSSDKQKCYAQKWRLTSLKYGIDLIITTLFADSEVLSPFRFYEGSTKIAGTVNKKPVKGVGFAELLHAYKKPEISFLNKKEWNTAIPLKWELKNPDDGNPLKYKLEYSVGDQKKFLPIVSQLKDTSYIWDTKLFTGGEVIRIRVTGSSIDGTLKDTTIKLFFYTPFPGKN